MDSILMALQIVASLDKQSSGLGIPLTPFLRFSLPGLDILNFKAKSSCSHGKFQLAEDFRVSRKLHELESIANVIICFSTLGVAPIVEEVFPLLRVFREPCGDLIARTGTFGEDNNLISAFALHLNRIEVVWIFAG